MRRSTKILAICAFVPLLVLALWFPLVEPALVKFPTSVHTTNHYEGVFTLLADQKTGAPLATPVKLPLTVYRDVRTAKDGTSSGRTALRENVTIDVAGNVQHQSFTFVLDRRSMRNVDDPRSQDFGSPVERKGTYNPQFPIGTKSDRTYRGWNSETGTTYTVRRSSGPAEGTVAGMTVLRMTGTLPPRPVTPAFLSELKAQGLPMTIAPDQFAAQLQAAGVDVSGVLSGLAQVLPPEENAALVQALSKPLPLQYLWSTVGDIGIDPTTGTVIAVDHSLRSLDVSVDASAFAGAAAILGRHQDIPLVKTVTTQLTSLLSRPAQHVYSLEFRETPDSTQLIADTARSQGRKVHLVRRWIPAGLGLVTIALAIGAVISARPRRPVSARVPVIRGPAAPRPA